MKNVIVRLLAAIGLVPARRYVRLSNELNRELRTWQKRAGKATDRVAALERRIEELQKELQRQVQKMKKARPVGERELPDLAPMEARLVEAERAAALAREHLMAIEVKLDILEGAANVLDARTRTTPSLQPRPDKTGAAV